MPARAAAEDTGARSPSTVETALLLLLGGALVALAFAVVPARTLAALSTGLVEHRSDIGLAMAVTVALGAAVVVFVLGT